MVFSERKFRAEKFLKEIRNKIGVRSISDIINDKPIALDVEDKINYIRHYFTYYDGNRSLFFDKRGKPNKRKRILNEIIRQIVLKQRDPSILKKVNKKILSLRSNQLEKLRKLAEQQEQHEKEKDIRNYRFHDWYIKSIENNNPNFERWRNNIIEFINSSENNLDPYLIKHIRYKRIKDLVNKWKMKKNFYDDYNKYLLDTYPINELIYPIESDKNV